ncbi:MAG: hypothetical protein LC753_11915 [Acidobacteria bacterium]|nr:hypothetical protein [Acidobacteriota bacterium]MCA1650942.1 hypothetical protein [Acidobacteriota bacterium]
MPHDPGDPILNTWILWWNAHTFPFTNGWWDPPIFYPMRGALALSEHLAGIALISTPVQLAGGNAILGYNVALLLSYALSGVFAFALVERLTGSRLAALCAGLAYACAPYRAGQLAHIQVLTSQWIPLALLGLHGWLETGRRRWLILFGAAWLVQALSNGYYLLFVPVLIVLWLAWFVDWRRAPRMGLAIIAVWMAASLPLIPILLKYRDVHETLALSRSAGDVERFSARPSSFLNAPYMLAAWPPRSVRTEEDYLFPGVTGIALIAAALAAPLWRRHGGRTVFRHRSPLLFYAVAASVMALLALGPAPGESWKILIRPYAWIAWLPGYEALRVPARFGMLFAFCLSIAAGLAVHQITPSRRAARFALATVAIAGIALDGWYERMPLMAPPGRVVLPDVPHAAVFELPPDDTFVSVMSMYRGIFHGRPLINGYSGHMPPHYTIVSLALRRGDPSAVLELARGRPLILLLSSRSDPSGQLQRLVEALPGIERRDVSSGGNTYVLPAQARERVARGGDALPHTVTEEPREHVVFDLGAERVARTIEFPLRWRYEEMGLRLAVEVSTDRVRWTTAWEGFTGGAAVAGALESPLEVPVRLPLADVRARFIRIHPAPPWLWRDLKVLAPG